MNWAFELTCVWASALGTWVVVLCRRPVTVLTGASDLMLRSAQVPWISTGNCNSMRTSHGLRLFDILALPFSVSLCLHVIEAIPCVCPFNSVQISPALPPLRVELWRLGCPVVVHEWSQFWCLVSARALAFLLTWHPYFRSAGYALFIPFCFLSTFLTWFWGVICPAFLGAL